MPTVYTLWRGDVQLGRFTERHPVLGDGDRVVGSSGLLELAVASHELSSVRQTHGPAWPPFSSALIEIPIEPIRFGPDGNRVGKPREVALLEPMSEEQSRDLPDDRILRVKEENGRVLETRSVMLQQIVIPDGVPLFGIHRARGLSEEEREVWSVTFVSRSR